ncbi:TPA: hypothetical protein ACWZZ6_001674 [Streptococcus agalactiae]|uniref:hypothetical protein n=1 Tax=Streptococcus agalactiae TaxID=1311 RepID=UPI00387CBD33
MRRKDEKKYLLLLPIVLIIVAVVGILNHKKMPDEGRYYLTEKNYNNHTISLNKTEFFTITDDQVTYTKNGELEKISYDSKNNELLLNGKKFWTHFASGELQLTDPKNTDMTLNYASKNSPLFKSYEKGTAKFKEEN